MSTNKLTELTAALAAAKREDAAAAHSGVAKWDEALDFAYKAMPLAPALIQTAEFLADALPGIKAYAEGLTNESFRSMWHNQIAKYEASLAALGLGTISAAEPAPAPASTYAVTQDEVENVLSQYVLRIVDPKDQGVDELAAELIGTLNFTTVIAEANKAEHPMAKRQAAFNAIHQLLVKEGIIEF